MFGSESVALCDILQVDQVDSFQCHVFLVPQSLLGQAQVSPCCSHGLRGLGIQEGLRDGLPRHKPRHKPRQKSCEICVLLPAFCLVLKLAGRKWGREEEYDRCIQACLNSALVPTMYTFFTETQQARKWRDRESGFCHLLPISIISRFKSKL